MVTIFTFSDSAEAYKLRDFLSRNSVAYQSVFLSDANKISEAGFSPTDAEPIAVLQNGRQLFKPSVNELAIALGLIKNIEEKIYDVAIYGAGPAGLSAAVYAGSEGLKTIVFEEIAVGGQAGQSSRIENYMGFPNGISGALLASRARRQALKFGAEIILLGRGVRGERKDGLIQVHLHDGTVIRSKATLFATGIQYQRLNVSNEEKYLNLGLYYGAGTSEVDNCKGQHVIIIGGGNSAGQAALNFSKYAARVTMVVRGKTLSESLSEYLTQRIEKSAVINVLYESELVGLEGNQCIEYIQVKTKEKTERIATCKVFVCIGGKPHTEWAKEVNVLTRAGYLLTGPDLVVGGARPEGWPLNRDPFFLETSKPGVFAAGDVRFGSVKRVASAVGEGAMAVTLIHAYLAELINKQPAD